ncbi:hypothetical protein EDD17DRAFT_1538270 [Pisolithus thermaeus]|nr:hypothetical protein EV401DRAFT_1058865 [Pisolithus croceorrhizus]KAI6167557.1 hypothetical protein EDD17DRAFT_1538270 [Pisolithus thermaeus]
MLARAVLVLCLSSRFVAAVSSSLPTAEVGPRQESPVFIPAPLPSATSIIVNNTIQTADGPLVETCDLIFVPDGQNIQQIENCTMATGGFNVATSIVTPSPSANSISVNIIPAPTGTLVQSAASSSPAVVAAFVMPGRSLQVLPVGLCIYAGVTALTFSFVAFVTYERVQYRKAFEQRRMIEQMIVAKVSS